MSNKISIEFLGGASSIGASATIVEVDNTRIVIDCGIRQQGTNQLPHLDALSNKKIDAILVTHAHTDHTGALPLLHTDNPETPVYATPPTADLMRILFQDSLKIMGSEDREMELPLFRKQDVDSLMENLHPIHWMQSFKVGDIEVRFLPAGHILGASMIHLATPYGHVLFTGDFCVSPQRTVDGLEIFKLPVDILITESTYGNRLHSDRKLMEANILQTIEKIASQNGRVLIPAFALGRAQEVILILKDAFKAKKLPAIPVYVDGLVRPMCGVYRSHPKYLNKMLAKKAVREKSMFYDENIRMVEFKPGARNEVINTHPSIIIASSGMLTGGASAFYAETILSSENDCVLFSGYQDEESPGRALLNLLDKPQNERTLNTLKGNVNIKCKIEAFSLSAHADKMQIMRLCQYYNPKCIITIHGDSAAQNSLVKALDHSDVVMGMEGVAIERSYPRRSLPAELIGIIGLVDDLQINTTDNNYGESPSAKRNTRKDLVAYCNDNMIPEPAITFFTENECTTCTIKFNLFGYEVSVSEIGDAIDTAEMKAVESSLNMLSTEGYLSRYGCDLKKHLTDFDIQKLREINYKGRYMEWAVLQNPTPKLRIEQVSLTQTLHAARGFVSLKSMEIVTSIYFYKSKKSPEAAVYAEIFNKIQANTDSNPKYTQPVIQPETPLDSQDAKMWLNEIKQKKLIRDFGYRLLKTDGQSHTPEFYLEGYLILPDDSRIVSPVVMDRTKKNAESQAAIFLKELFLKTNIN